MGNGGASGHGRRSEESALEQLVAAVTLSRRQGVGAKVFKELVTRFGSPALALAEHLEVPPATSTRPKAPLDQSLLESLAQLPVDVRFTVFGAQDFPPALAGTPEPPPYLFRKGPLWPIPREAVAIVGPRRGSARGEAFARELASRLAIKGAAVVSGGAPGVDASAHAGALEVGGPTVMVAATGIDRAYPDATLELRREVEARGCVMTELLPGAPPRRGFFPTRNRILVGLSAATVIVGGEAQSGTSSSADQAVKLGRPVFVWAPNIEDRHGELTERLLSRGASEIRSSDPSPVLEAMRARMVWC